MAGDDKQVLLGKIAATHGIRGQLKVVTFSGDPDTILALKSVTLKGSKGESGVFKVAASAVHGKRVLLSLEGFNDINQVLHLVGRELYTDRSQLPALPPGEYYWCDLLGLTVRTIDGSVLGTLVEIIATGSNDVYVVRGDDREYLLPALEEVVLQVSLDDGIMIVEPSEGLLDL